MHSKNFPVFFIVASLSSTSLGLTARHSFDIILARQAPPAPCAPVCDGIQSTVTACGESTSCICTSANAADVQTCVNCAIGADPSPSIIESANTLIDAFESTCRSDNVPSITMPVINTSSGTPQSTPNTAIPSTTPVSATTAVPSSNSQSVIGSSSTTSAPNTALSVGSTSTSTSTSTSSTGGSPLNSSASTNKKILNWSVVLLGLAVGNLLVF